MDNVLCIGVNPKVVINYIASVYRVKDGSIEEPLRYLDMNSRKWVYTAMNGDSMSVYALGASIYMKEAVRVDEENCSDCNLTYKSQSRFDTCPFTHYTYRPKIGYIRILI